MDPNAPKTPTLQLPAQVVGPIDLSRLTREVDAIKDLLTESAIRSPGSTAKLTRTSRLLDEFAAVNKLNLLKSEDCDQALTFLTLLKTRAPVLHISFASDPSANFTIKLVTWLRANIHPGILLRIGLEPSIAAGCIVRSSNRQFDFSLRKHFTDNNQMLIKMFRGEGSS
jgi:hypothetical protein